MATGEYVAPNKITVAVAPGLTEVPAFKMAKPGAAGADPVRAKALKDQPSAMLQMENDVTMHVKAVVDGSKEILFIIEFKRDKK